MTVLSRTKGDRSRYRPDGGHGGNGGAVILVADPDQGQCFSQLVTGRPHLAAETGTNGTSSDCHGRTGRNLVVRVPCGVVVKRVLDEDEVWDDANKQVVGVVPDTRDDRIANTTVASVAGSAVVDAAETEQPGDRQVSAPEEGSTATVTTYGEPDAIGDDDSSDGYIPDHVLEDQLRQLRQGKEIEIFPEDHPDSPVVRHQPHDNNNSNSNNSNNQDWGETSSHAKKPRKVVLHPFQVYADSGRSRLARRV